VINIPAFAMTKKALVSATFCAFVSGVITSGLSQVALPAGNAIDGCLITINKRF